MNLPDKTTVNKLSDEELALAVQMIVTSSLWENLSLTRWEREFLPKMPEFYVRAGTFSWKQRRSVREIVLKVSEELYRRHLILGQEPVV